MRKNIGYAFTDDEIKKRVKRILDKTTNNLGRIEIRGNQIICHVNNKRLDKQLEINGNTLSLNGFTTDNKFFLKQIYDIDKPIKYIIDGYKFDDVFLDTIGDTTLQFNNCLFEGYDLNVGYINNIIFYNSRFHLDNGLNLFNNTNKQIENVKFIDCNFGYRLSIPGVDNIFIVSDKIYISGGIIFSSNGINLKSKETKLSNTAFYFEKYNKDGYTNIFSNKYVMNNSSINGSELKIISPSMHVRNSMFDNNYTEIYNKNCNIGELNNKLGKVKYNDITLLPQKTYYITPEIYELLKERERLANVLYKLNDKCDKEVKKKVRILKNKSVSETLGE